MKTFIVDSFTDRPFAGNPAGVCHVDSPLTDATMLQIAKELGLGHDEFVAARLAYQEHLASLQRLRGTRPDAAAPPTESPD